MGAEQLLDCLSPETLVVYDEAYYEFATHPQYPRDSLELMKKHRNMLVLRTLSKAYGLAGFRIGFTIGDPALLELINRIRNPFNVTSLTQAAALAALDDEEFLARTVANNNAGKEYLYGQLERLGLPYGRTEANHLMFDARRDAQAVFQALLNKGVIIRPVGGTWLRVSIGTMEENRVFISALEEVLAELPPLG
ncbi:MAG TPA: aminotransferase class I/II-fold pyridoxal phosphate-dependent enzyme [Limnochordia bacterium]|nr:aminotransferase class I/II-fold pyridoxal phosphate-dependent enzyme [Limnochordia bacterium]